MSRRYTHLNHTERTLIFWWLKEKLSIREMARRLHRSHSTISRELKRNRWSGKEWFPRGAQALYQMRLKNRAMRFRLKNEKIRRFTHQKLAIGWTPEIISGRLKLIDSGHYICHESIYQYIYCIAPELIEFLPRKHKRRRVKQPYRSKPEHIKGRQGLDFRPVGADDRSENGHWESDTIVSGDLKHGLNVIVERKNRVTHISLLKAKTAKETKEALVRRLEHYPEQFKQSITYDNGSENTQHQSVNAILGTDSYFCEPYHSWEKGSVEQVNGLVRRYLPKGTNFDTLDLGEINRIEKLLNNRPRKCLNFRTPYEVFRAERNAL